MLFELNYFPWDYLNKISNWIFMCKMVILSAFNFIEKIYTEV